MRIRPKAIRALLIAGTALSTLAVPLVSVSVIPAAAQVSSVSVEFRTALEPYGRWQNHRRWGEVWIPSRVARDWEPYTVGHWVYSQDYGWYWASDAEEADWGLITYHYGRWVFDDEFAWIWIPGTEWGPGWVQWRHGRQYAAWEPLPPDDVVVEYRERPQFWIFVRERDLVAPRIVDVILPLREREIFFSDTVVVNRTVVLEDRRFAVNPGIPPTYVAAAYGGPIPSYDVRPRVLAGTASVPGAVVVRAEDFRNRERVREITRESSFVRQTSNTITSARDLQPLQPLGVNERGRLGAVPPRAAQPGAATTGQNRREGPNAPTTQGAAPPAGQPPNQLAPSRQGQGAAPGQNRREGPNAPTTQGAAPPAGQQPNQLAPSRQGAAPGQPLQQGREGPQQQGREGRPGTQGVAPGAPSGPGAAQGELRSEGQRDQRNLRQGRPGTPSPNAPSTSGEAPRIPPTEAPGVRRPPNAAPGPEQRGGPEGRGTEERRGQTGNFPPREQGPSTSGAAPGGREGGGERDLRSRPPLAAPPPPQEPRGRERPGPGSEGQGPRSQNLGGERGASERSGPAAPTQPLQRPAERAPSRPRASSPRALRKGRDRNRQQLARPLVVCRRQALLRGDDPKSASACS